MAAAGNKVTAVHWSLIVFVTLFLIAAVFAYMNFSEAQTLSAERDKAVAEKNQLDQSLRTELEKIDALKKLIGHEFDEVGTADPQNPNMVLGAMRADMARYGGTLQQQTYSATIAKLREELTNVTGERDSLQANNNQLQQQILAALTSFYQTIAAQHDQARQTAEQDLRQNITQKEEAVAAKDTEINQLRTQNNQLQVDLKDEQDGRAKMEKALTKDITDLSLANDRLRDKLDEATKVSFEVADGEVRYVDHISGMVWINLGEIDNLPKRTTFSIYRKDHQGVGRGPEDIKGSIEVTRIISGHLAEARITNDDLYSPIAPGDPIYTPLWSPGRKEAFAFVGKIDLDNDGIGDRDLLHDIVASANATITSEVDDQGERIGGELDVHTKFLVVGDIPDLATTSKPEDKEQVQKMLKHRSDMGKEARKYGIRVVNLSDFLSYVGYQPQRRLFIPGLVGQKYNLKSGSHSTGTSQSINSPAVSSGTVSGAFTRSKRLNSSSSSGYRSGSVKSGY